MVPWGAYHLGLKELPAIKHLWLWIHHWDVENLASGIFWKIGRLWVREKFIIIFSVDSSSVKKLAYYRCNREDNKDCNRQDEDVSVEMQHWQLRRKLMGRILKNYVIVQSYRWFLRRGNYNIDWCFLFFSLMGTLIYVIFLWTCPLLTNLLPRECPQLQILLINWLEIGGLTVSMIGD